MRRDVVIAFAIGTGAAAIVCVHDDAPLVFWLVGGFIVPGVALALSSDSLVF